MVVATCSKKEHGLMSQDVKVLSAVYWHKILSWSVLWTGDLRGGAPAAPSRQSHKKEVDQPSCLPIGGIVKAENPCALQQTGGRDGILWNAGEEGSWQN